MSSAKFVIARRVLYMRTVITQFHTPAGWSRDEGNAYHFDYGTAAKGARNMGPGAYPAYASSNLRSGFRRVG